MRTLVNVLTPVILVLIGLESLPSGMVREILPVLDALFFRAALAFFLYLLWRLVKALEARNR